jgi:formamidopyrimidine-DNA glycosylase
MTGQLIMYISAMPEAPDLEVVKDYLNAELKDAVVESCKVLRPTVMRSLAGEASSALPGRTFLDAQRRGKFLTLRFSGGRSLVINPILTGALQHCDDSVRVLKKTSTVLGLTDGMQLRYLDDRQMGKVYYINNGEADGDSQDELIPQYTGLGPDVLSGITLQEFETRLKKFNGEIKGVLTQGVFISGIGNPYSDEILFAAGISPFKKCRALKPSELETLQPNAVRCWKEPPRLSGAEWARTFTRRCTTS